MERLLFAKVPAWVLIASLILSVIAMIGVAVLVHDSLAGPNRFGALSRAAGFVGGLPEQSLQSIRQGDPMLARAQGRFEGRSGWTVEPETALSGYLLLSRFDGDSRRHAVELVDLDGFEVVRRWSPEADRLFEGVAGIDDPERNTLWRSDRFRMIHPAITPAGQLVVKDHLSPIFGLDLCGALLWRTEETEFHHSTALAGDGTLWVPARASTEIDGLRTGDRLQNDSLAHVSAGGEMLENRGLAGIMLRSGMVGDFLTYGNGSAIDPFHLNDIEPVRAGGDHWRKGDLFLSLRAMSTIALYRPSLDRIVWHRRGPWLTQHDVDVLDDHRIAVYSNNTYDLGAGRYVYGANEVYVYDFASDRVTSPFRAAMRKEHVVTATEGLFEFLPGGQILVEEENNGRLLVLSADGARLADYVNRASDGRIYRLGWSRYMDRTAGDRVKRQIQAASCGE